MNDARTGCLVLVPVSLGETAWQRFLPAEAHAEAVSIRHFVVENAKAARAQLKRLEHPLPMTELDITPLPPNGPNDELDRLLGPTARGLDVGLMSDAGCPGVADPGARLVARAHALNVRVRPLVGPSSILLALMASGLDGQRFAFDGYLPVAEAARDARIRSLEEDSRRQSRTQIFIETPYRNERLFDALLRQARPGTRLCIACDLTCASERLVTRSIGEWRTMARPDLARRPALFLMLAER